VLYTTVFRVCSMRGSGCLVCLCIYILWGRGVSNFQYIFIIHGFVLNLFLVVR
jgi:hypothetical protein